MPALEYFCSRMFMTFGYSANLIVFSALNWPWNRRGDGHPRKPCAGPSGHISQVPACPETLQGLGHHRSPPPSSLKLRHFYRSGILIAFIWVCLCSTVDSRQWSETLSVLLLQPPFAEPQLCARHCLPNGSQAHLLTIALWAPCFYGRSADRSVVRDHAGSL